MYSIHIFSCHKCSQSQILFIENHYLYLFMGVIKLTRVAKWILNVDFGDRKEKN